MSRTEHVANPWHNMHPFVWRKWERHSDQLRASSNQLSGCSSYRHSFAIVNIVRDVFTEKTIFRPCLSCISDIWYVCPLNLTVSPFSFIYLFMFKFIHLFIFPHISIHPSPCQSLTQSLPTLHSIRASWWNSSKVILFQIVLCLAVKCAGVSIIWCAVGGWILMDLQKQSNELLHEIFPFRVLVLLVDQLAISYYAITMEPITTVAHL